MYWKSVTILLVTASLVWGVPPFDPQPPREVLLWGEDFESKPRAWRPVMDPPGQANLSWDPAGGRGSGGGLRIDNASVTAAWEQTSRPLLPGSDRRFRVTGWVRSDRTDVTGPRVMLAVAWYDDGGDLLVQDERETVSYRRMKHWAFVSLVTAPADEAAVGRIRLVAEAGMESAWFDDISVWQVHGERPEITMERDVLCLNGEWEVTKGSWEAGDPPGEGAVWRRDWVPFADKPARVRMRGSDVWWYRRRFLIPEQFGGQSLRLRFIAVQYGADVWLNGAYMGSRDSFMSDVPFEIDVTPAARPGRDNEVVIRVTSHRIAGADPPLGLHPTPEEIAAARAASKRMIVTGWWDGTATGITQDVFLVPYPQVFLDDIFVKTSVKDHMITAQTTIRNSGEKTAAVRIRSRIVGVDDGGTIKELPEQIVRVPAGGQVVREVCAAWKNPRLWWPHDPYLYGLHSELIGPDSRVIDRFSRRFGFREVGTKGPDFLINGVRFRALADGYTYACNSSHDLYSKSGMVSLYRAMRSNNIRVFRVQGKLWPEYAYEAADEAGMMIIGEPSAFNAALMLEHPDIYRRQFREWVFRDRNHPSLLMWSMMNEVFTNEQPEAILNGMVTLGGLVKQLDPTRPIEYESDHDPASQVSDKELAAAGAADVLNLHYPERSGYAYLDYPNSLYWWDAGRSTLRHPYFVKGRLWKWDRRKPVYVGEAANILARTPDQGAIFLGDASYHRQHDHNRMPASTAKALLWTMMLEAYRNQGISGMSPWSIFEAGGFNEDNPSLMAKRDAYAPIAAFRKELNHTFSSGQTVRRTVFVHNDSLAAAELVFRWSVTSGSDEVDDGSERLELEPAASQQLSFDMHAPKVTSRKDGFLRLAVENAGREVFVAEHPISFLPRQVVPKVKREIVLYDPIGQTRLMLDHNRVSHRLVARIADVLHKGGTTLIIGAGAMDKTILRQAKAIERYVAGGGRVIVFEQSEWVPEWLPARVNLAMTAVEHDPPYVNLTDPRIARHVAGAAGYPLNLTMCYRRAVGHPLLEGTAKDDFRFWAGNHLVTAGAFEKPARGGSRSIIDAATHKGLIYSPLLEIPWGRGTYLLCQLRITEQWAQEPVAGLMLRNLLHYADTMDRAARSTLVLAGKEGPVSSRLDDIGLDYVIFQSKDLSRADLAGKGLVILSGDRACWDAVGARTERLHRFAAKGGTVIIHAVTPESLQRAREIAGLSFGLSGEGDAPVRIAAADQLLWGVSSRSLHWLEKPGKRFEILVVPSPAAHYVRLPDHSGSLEAPDSVAKALTEPAALVKIPVGSGRVIIDQLLWESQGDQNSDKVGRYLSGLLTNVDASFHSQREQ